MTVRVPLSRKELWHLYALLTNFPESTEEELGEEGAGKLLAKLQDAYRKAKP